MRTQAPGNLVLSPDSVATALAMAGTGAAGRTATQIAEALHLSTPAALADLGDLQGAIANERASAGEGHPKAPTLDLANGLFVQRGLPIEPTFLSGLLRHFGAAPEIADFSGDPSGSLNTINEWASNHTSGLIPKLFESLPPETRLILANAVYLHASWLHPFAPAETAPAPFHSPSGSTSAQFMHETERLRYASGRGYKAVDLPYRASTLSLLVVLPRKKSVGGLLRQLGTRGLTRIVESLSPAMVGVSLPRFHLHTQTSLNDALMSLGMTAAFGESADFSGIAGDRSLKIGVVEHAADFTVDEEGTVAAAATGVDVELAASIEAVTFNANRPFLFFLRDRRTGAVLFAGRVTKPTPAGT